MDSYLKKFLTIRRRKILPHDIQLRFLKRLARLLVNGYPLISALEVIKWDKQMVITADQMISSLKDGTPIDQAFEKANFHSSITTYLYFARENGDIQTSIKKCISIYEDRLKYIKKFQDIARYPLILLIIFLFLLYFIKRSVLPSFIDLFQTSSESSTMITFSMKLIEYSITLLFICGLLFCFTWVLWHINKRRIHVKTQIKMYRFIPIYRHFLRLQTSFQFATHLSALLKTGMSLKEILHSMSEQNKLPIIAYYATLMTKELGEGRHISSLLSQLTFLERQVAVIFQKNADKEALEKDLSMYADLLTEELQRKIMRALTFIQPVFFILLACFVILIYMTLMLPMYQLINNI